MLKSKFYFKLFLDLSMWMVPALCFLISYFGLDFGNIYNELHFFIFIAYLYSASFILRVLREYLFCKKKMLFFNNLLRIIISTIFGIIINILLFYYFISFLSLHFHGFSGVSYDIFDYYALKLNEINGFQWLTPAVFQAMIIMGAFICSGLYARLFNATNWHIGLIVNQSKTVVTGVMLFTLVLTLKLTLVFMFIKIDPKDSFPAAKAVDSRHNIEGHFIDDKTALVMDKLAEQERKILLPSKNKDKPNLIFIVVDALRSNHMSLYGYNRETTLYLDHLNKEGRVRLIQNMRSTCSDTACGMLSMISSKYAAQFSFNPITLHEILRENHYKINLIFSGTQFNFFNLGSYYGKVNNFFDSSMQKKYKVNDDQIAIDHLKSYANWDGKPTMFQFHLMSSHIIRDKKYYENKFHPSMNYIDSASQIPENAAAINNFYDNGVLYSDNFIKQILEQLKLKNYLNNALVVIVGDHGDGMGEHGLYTHANTVYEEMIRIPFVMIDYNHKPFMLKQNNIAPGQVDFAPTILKELNIDIPKTWSGLPVGDAKQNNLLYFEESRNYGLLDKHTLTDPYKYWINLDNKTEQAFDIKNDPFEKNNLIGKVPSLVKKQWKICVLSRKNAPEIQDCKE